MKFKTFIAVVFASLMLCFTGVSFASSSQNSSVQTVQGDLEDYLNNPDYICEECVIDGVKYIYVYTLDSSLVEVYIEEE